MDATFASIDLRLFSQEAMTLPVSRCVYAVN